MLPPQTAELHTLIGAGAALGICADTTKLVELMSEVRPTMLISVPAVFKRVYDGINNKMNDEGGLKKMLFRRAIKVCFLYVCCDSEL